MAGLLVDSPALYWSVAMFRTSLGLILIACSSMLADGAEPAPQSTEQLLKRFVAEFVEITPGKGTFPASFQFGEVTPQEVTLSQPFAMAKYEVPQNLYAAVMGSNPSRWTGPRNSVEMLTWSQARDFCSKITGLLHAQKLIAEDEVIRLPSEVEWEYCCRAGTTTAYSFGDGAQAESDVSPKATLLDKYGWHTGNAAGNDPPVGALAPNPWGLYDMHGYLWEFCEDAWHTGPVTATPHTKADTTQVVIRGGSWKDRFPDLRSAYRKPFPVAGKDDAVGFRCVRAKK
ncbi:MAG: formylglycine-generating enzyme family protein [Planctomycetaceae bacterium]|nr:formylglycine-generating enzyme family protein [Planctomycetaceae bacterium]